MMVEEIEIKKAQDDKLLMSLEQLFQNERRTSQLIVIHLREIEERKLYAKRGYSSLLKMLVEYYKISEGSAYRRIQAMRLIRDVPEAQDNLLNGNVNLTTLSMAQSQIRREEKISGEKVSIERKTEIVERLKNKTQTQAEIELFKLLPQSASFPQTQERRISADLTYLGLNLPDRVLNKLKRLRELWSHVDASMDYVEIIDRSADESLKRLDPLQKEVKRKPAAMKQGNTTLEKHQVKSRRPTYFSVEVQKRVHEKARSCCEYVDPITQKRCGSKTLVQIDHVIPIWAGGGNDLANLQLLCGTHNRLKYQLEIGRTSLVDQKVDYVRSPRLRQVI